MTDLDKKRAESRARFPDIAAFTDKLTPGSFRVLCIHDHAGKLLAGTEPRDFDPAPIPDRTPTIVAAPVAPVYRGKPRR